MQTRVLGLLSEKYVRSRIAVRLCRDSCVLVGLLSPFFSVVSASTAVDAPGLPGGFLRGTARLHAPRPAMIATPSAGNATWKWTASSPTPFLAISTVSKTTPSSLKAKGP